MQQFFKKPAKLNDHQGGAASIYISGVVMVILTLIVVVFAQIVGNNYLEITESQYHLQAYYAAESSINDVRAEIHREIKDIQSNTSASNQDIDAALSSLNKDKCDDMSVTSSVLEDKDLSNNIESLCVLVDVSPKALIYDSVDTNRSLILNLEPVDKMGSPTNLNKLIFEWDHHNDNSSSRGGESGFTNASTWEANTIPVLRVQIIPVADPISFTRDDLKDNSRVFFLYPNDGSNNNSMWPPLGDDGKIIDGNCKDTPPNPRKLKCETSIDVSSFTNPNTRYVVRVQSIYNKAKLVLRGEYLGNTQEPAKFKNIQAEITATGRSNNIAERLRERIPLRPIYDLPEYGIDSAGDLCKILVTTEAEGVFLSQENRFPSGNLSCSIERS